MKIIPTGLRDQFSYDADIPFPAAMEIGTNLMDKSHAE